MTTFDYFNVASILPHQVSSSSSMVTPPSSTALVEDRHDDDDDDDEKTEESMCLSKRACFILQEYRVLLVEWMRWMVSLTPYIMNPSNGMPSLSDSVTFKMFLERFHKQQALWLHITRELEDHQKHYLNLLETYREVNRSRERQKNLASLLLTCRDHLKQTLHSIETRTNLHRDLEPISVSHLLSYSRKIAYTSSAPPRWNPSLPLRVTRPPAPQEDAMRSGHLYRHSLGSSSQRFES